MNKEQKLYENIFKSEVAQANDATIGKAAKHIYDSFIKAGFTEEQALELLKALLIAGVSSI